MGLFHKKNPMEEFLPWATLVVSAADMLLRHKKESRQYVDDSPSSLFPLREFTAAVSSCEDCPYKRAVEKAMGNIPK